MNSSKVLVAFFSANDGATKEAAEKIASAAQGDLYEIVPEKPYTKEDLDYNNEQSRTSLEAKDPNCRPALGGKKLDVSGYSEIYLGFPIWWNREPALIDSFLDAHDWAGKVIMPFYTSGGAGAKRTAERIQNLIGKDARVMECKRVGGTISREDLKLWANDENGSW